MKILELIDSLSPGGGQRFVVDLSNELAKNNDVYLGKIRVGSNSEFYKDELVSNVRLITYNGSYSKLSKIFQIFAVIRMIATLKPDVVHSHLVTFNYIIIPTLLFPKIKFFYTVHNLADKDTTPGLSKFFKRFLFKKLVKAITISELCEQSFIDYFGYSSAKIIENGCREIYTTSEFETTKKEVEGYKKSVDTKIYVNVARLMEQKNHSLLIESFNEFVSQGYDAILLIIGDYSASDEMKDVVKARLDAIPKTNRVYFLGTKHNVIDYLTIADYFCLSSKWEGLPISLLEAGLSGTYPVCTPVGGIPDVIKNENWGTLSNDTTKESYLKVLKFVFGKDVNRERLKRLYANRYSMKVCAENYQKMFLR